MLNKYKSRLIDIGHLTQGHSNSACICILLNNLAGNKKKLHPYTSTVRNISVCGWVSTFVRMCVWNFLFTLGPSLVFRSTPLVFNRPSSVFSRPSLVLKSMSLVF